MRTILLLFAMTWLVYADDRGIPPRFNPSEYPAHQATEGAILAAAIVPVKQVERMFSQDISRHYIVLEVAVYPQNGLTFDIDWFDFRLKVGEMMAYVEKPRDVATPWPDKGPSPDKPVTVITDAGVVYSRGNDPVNGRRSGWGTYEGVGVTNDPRAAAPPSPRQQPDPQILEQRVTEMMLPPGQTKSPVAGYLFFPQDKLKRHKDTSMELQWSKNRSSLSLRLPPK